MVALPVAALRGCAEIVPLDATHGRPVATEELQPEGAHPVSAMTNQKPQKTKPSPPIPPLAGTVELRGGVYSLRVRIAGERKRFKLGLVSEMSEEKAREKGAAWLERMARERVTPDAKGPASPLAAVTVKAHFTAWTSGKLYELHGPVNGLRTLASASENAYRAGRWVYPVIGPTPVADVTEEQIEKVLARIPEAQAGTRVKVYALLRRGFDLAVRPARLRADNPVTKYQRPTKPGRKLFAYLLPVELLAVLACVEVPLGRRVLYALAVYTGLRKGSLYALRWSGVDLANRTILSKVSKTGIAQMFEIPAGLCWVLRGWRALIEELHGPEAVAPLAPVVQQLKIERGKGGEAEALRADLQAAGVTRSALFEGGANLEPLRFHDLRGTFVTWAKRAGKGDGWITDRTAHLTPEMVDRYTRAARTLEDLRIEPFPELVGTIPELVGKGDAPPAPSAPAGKGGAPGASSPSGGSTPVADPGTPASSTEGAEASVDGVAHVGPSTDPRTLTSPEGEGTIPQKPRGKQRLTAREGRFRFQWGNSRGGSSPPLRTAVIQGVSGSAQGPEGSTGTPAGSNGGSNEAGEPPAAAPPWEGARGGKDAPAKLVAIEPRPDSSAPAGDPAPSPRASLLEVLLAGEAAAIVTGDLTAARIAHEAIGKLLGAEAAEPREGAPVVVDLASERGKRGRR